MSLGDSAAGNGITVEMQSSVQFPALAKLKFHTVRNPTQVTAAHKLLYRRHFWRQAMIFKPSHTGAQPVQEIIPRVHSLSLIALA